MKVDNEMKSRLWVIVLMLLICSAALYGKGPKLVQYARAQLGTAYRYNGRGTQSLPDLDCMGLCFRAYENVYAERWTKYSVIPSKLIKAGDLGRPIDRVAHIYSEEFAGMLQPGDIIYFLVDYKAIQDEAVATDGDTSWWVYHMGMHTEEGRIIHASPWAGKVVEEDLQVFSGQFRFLVTRRQ